MLGCPEGGETMFRNAVAAVDNEMTLIRDAGKVKARERIAVLAALNLAFQLAEKSNAPPAEPPAPATAARADEALTVQQNQRGSLAAAHRCRAQRRRPIAVTSGAPARTQVRKLRGLE